MRILPGFCMKGYFDAFFPLCASQTLTTMVYVPDRVWYVHLNGCIEDELSFIGKYGPPKRKVFRFKTEEEVQHARRMDQYNEMVWRNTPRGKAIMRENEKNAGLAEEYLKKYSANAAGQVIDLFGGDIISGITDLFD